MHTYEVRKTRGLIHNKIEKAKTTFQSVVRDHSGEVIPPPDPKLLRIHTALANLIHISGLGSYLHEVEKEPGREEAISPDGQTDIGPLLSSKLAVRAFHEYRRDNHYHQQSQSNMNK